MSSVELFVVLFKKNVALPLRLLQKNSASFALNFRCFYIVYCWEGFKEQKPAIYFHVEVAIDDNHAAVAIPGQRLSHN